MYMICTCYIQDSCTCPQLLHPAAHTTGHYVHMSCAHVYVQYLHLVYMYTWCAHSYHPLLSARKQTRQYNNPFGRVHVVLNITSLCTLCIYIWFNLCICKRAHPGMSLCLSPCKYAYYVQSCVCILAMYIVCTVQQLYCFAIATAYQLLHALQSRTFHYLHLVSPLQVHVTP
jgi:hypothetical protein